MLGRRGRGCGVLAASTRRKDAETGNERRETEMQSIDEVHRWRRMERQSIEEVHRGRKKEMWSIEETNGGRRTEIRRCQDEGEDAQEERGHISLTIDNVVAEYRIAGRNKCNRTGPVALPPVLWIEYATRSRVNRIPAENAENI
ncbi:hypothetical protein NDU88_008144 [Pleurodeles waltl]|uniref:Uncharacterized protein n=1 Tax=Pleurodeles waltl TaxID=8319 RepID=A0AAV7N435_PLEWA|nr:hypothetical protein NDU88_008144 [Pleurodeles waltl]